MSLWDGFKSLAKNLNKYQGNGMDENVEGVVSEEMSELNLDLSDEELISTKNKWERKWEVSDIKIAVNKMQDENEKYWKGEQFDDENPKRPLADNLIFESVETFLPIITRQRPEPVVEADNTEDGNSLAMKVQKMLVFQADRLRLKLKIKKLARFWMLYLLGVVKVGWNELENDIELMVLRPQKIILDPEANIEDGEYRGEYIGEYRKDSAKNLIKRFPKKEEYIKELVNDKLGTQVQYIEWWTNEYVFWTLKDEVLLKAKNPHWNYDGKNNTVDEFGNKIEIEEKGNNHFSNPKKPYIFLTVYDLGLGPFDSTSIIQQNLALQDLVNKRLKQIDKNADNTNGGLLISGDNFDKEQATQVAEALRKGKPAWVPKGNVGNAINRTIAPPLPNFVYQSLQDYRGELRNIFGVRGASPQGILNESTVRGKILIKGQDGDRASTITDYVEQVADEIYNWMVQLMYVYYDEDHVASVIGKERSKEYISLRKSDFNTKLMVSVKEGSLIPHDQLTERNTAVELFMSGNLDPITAFEKLDFPNPRESAEKLFTWKSSPEVLFPNVVPKQEAQPGLPPQGGPEGTQSLPPEGLGAPGQQPPQDILNQIPIPQ